MPPHHPVDPEPTEKCSHGHHECLSFNIQVRRQQSQDGKPIRCYRLDVSLGTAAATCRVRFNRLPDYGEIQSSDLRFWFEIIKRLGLRPPICYLLRNAY